MTPRERIYPTLHRPNPELGMLKGKRVRGTTPRPGALRPRCADPAAVKRQSYPTRGRQRSWTTCT
jgi:hypothetical protein